MPRYVALLRAVNVGGTGRLPMNELKAMCVDAGFSAVETYIASGNVLFSSDASEEAVRAALESRLSQRTDRPAAAFVRSAPEMRAVLRANPFTDAGPAQVYVIFLHAAPGEDIESRARGRSDERIAVGRREVYVHFPSGMGNSKLRLDELSQGTARNMNTIARLVDLISK